MATIRKFEDLEVWQLAHKLCKQIFVITEKGSFVKDYGYKGQIKDSSGSVMDNIAEGFGRGGNKEFVNFLSFSTGSACEVQSQLHRALSWKYISEKEFKESYDLADEIINKNGNFISYLNSTEYKGDKFKRKN